MYLFSWSVYMVVWLFCRRAAETLAVFIGLRTGPTDAKPDPVSTVLLG